MTQKQAPQDPLAKIEAGKSANFITTVPIPRGEAIYRVYVDGICRSAWGTLEHAEFALSQYMVGG